MGPGRTATVARSSYSPARRRENGSGFVRPRDPDTGVVMESKQVADLGAGCGPIDLVPRLEGQGYRAEEIERRRRWVEERTGCRLHHIGAYSIPGEAMRGNVENPVGAAQVPLGMAGPLLVHGEHARGEFYVPLATTEGALVRSYERGMVTL